MSTLSCGHAPTPRSATPGYATDARTGRTSCLPCAERAELADFLATPAGGRYGAYLSSDERELTTWTGAHLARVTEVNHTNAGFSGGCVSTGGRVYFRAVDERGQHWHGNSPGGGMYARAKRNKE